MVAYDDWMPEFQDIWEELPTSELSDADREWAEYLFEEGFMTYHGEAPPASIEYAREEFFDLIGEEWEDWFDWDAWREAMGYELCHALAPKRSPGIGIIPANGRPLGVLH